MKIFTIGFTATDAESFFECIKRAQVKCLIDVRLNNLSQLSGFAKKRDLRYFLNEICGVCYKHEPMLAPTSSLLDDYRKKRVSWGAYELSFTKLLREREIERHLKRDEMDSICLLCSEHQPHRCHRRLVAEYLKEKWEDIDIDHLIPREGLEKDEDCHNGFNPI